MICQTSNTLLRRFIINIAPKKPPKWINSKVAWKAYSILESGAIRFQDIAMEMEDHENSNTR